jgi:hypothetical protein
VEESAVDEQQDDRKAIASALIVKHIRFDLIASLDLSNAVAASGLLTTEQLLEAYKSHIELAGKITSQPLFTKRMPYWETLKSTIATFGIRANIEKRAWQRLCCKEMASARLVHRSDKIPLSESEMWAWCSSWREFWWLSPKMGLWKFFGQELVY